MTIVIVTEDSGTEAMYVDGDLVAQEETIYASEIAAAAGGKPFTLKHRTIELEGRWPALLSDVPKLDQ